MGKGSMQCKAGRTVQPPAQKSLNKVNNLSARTVRLHATSALALLVAGLMALLLTGQHSRPIAPELPPRQSSPPALSQPIYARPRTSSEELTVDCTALVEEGECDSQGDFMQKVCPGVCAALARRVLKVAKPAGLKIDHLQEQQKEPVPRILLKNEASVDASKLSAALPALQNETTAAPVDKHEHCGYWTAHGECEKNAAYMLAECPASCTRASSVQKSTTFSSGVHTTAASSGSKPDNHEHCAFWASHGECEKNARFMLEQCATSCASPKSSAKAADTPVGKSAATDLHEDCAAWVKDGECYRNPAFMLQQCRASCERFAESNENILQDTSDSCVNFALQGGCESNAHKASTQCRASCHIQRICGNQTDAVVCQKALRCEAIQDKHASCERRAAQGECRTQPQTMLRDCLKSCSESDLQGLMQFHLPHKRTILSPLIDLPGAPPRVAGHYSTPPGAINSDPEALAICPPAPKAFVARLSMVLAARRQRQPWNREHWVTRGKQLPGRERTPRVPHGFTKVAADLGNSRLVSVEQISYSPRIRYLHRFLTFDECDHIIELGHSLFARSPVRGSVTRVRTSSTAMLRGGARGDPVVQRIRERISRFSGYPERNIEPLQVVRYYQGQKYDSHHDFFDLCDLDDKAKHGRRQMTFLIYLVDMPEGETGGGTSFPELNVAATPERGSAVVFNDCLDNGAEDHRSLHAALPPVNPNSVKYAITVWIRSHPVADFMH
uniref:Fe2OG dioxygenase domain-containing protein n=1 Tax=Chrysotila carterae TaxID=13221 RepID=A0A7S4EWB3_CHRCT|mmetsp:Transcript_1139/g.2184  ORF Transcript_1139/g.2184 Transcript_1139/m.2184 type:complete len:730 (-) Transcript_1139:482-2671(-)